MRTHKLMLLIWVMSLLLLFLQCDNSNVTDLGATAERDPAAAEEVDEESDTENDAASEHSDTVADFSPDSIDDDVFTQEALGALTSSAPEGVGDMSHAPEASEHAQLHQVQTVLEQRDYPRAMDLNAMIGLLNGTIGLRSAEADQTVLNFIQGHEVCVLNTPSAKGNTLLHAAVKHHREKVVEALIAKQVDLLCKAKRSRMTALHIAAGDGYVAIMKLLIEAARDQGKTPQLLNAETFKKRTPLFSAVLAKQAGAVKLLLESGADPSLREFTKAVRLRGEFTPYRLARFLRRHGGMQPVLDVFEEFKQNNPAAFEHEATFFKGFKKFRHKLGQHPSS